MLLEIRSKLVEIIKGQEKRWITFDVSSFVPGIQGMKKKYIKFVLRVTPYAGGSVINPVVLGIQAHNAKDTERALLVIFTTEDAQNSRKNSRIKRGVDSNSKTSRRNKKRKKKRRRRKKKLCRKKHMVVPLYLFAWGNWLLSPPDFDAYYCHGRCEYPVASHLTPTNHATIQTIVHGINKDFVPPACCVPTEFGPLPGFTA